MTTGINQNNNICVALNYLYASLLRFIEKYEFSDQQVKFINNIKLNLEIALPFGKYTTSKLEDFKKREDPTYINQKQFFEEDMEDSYIKEMRDEVEKIKKSCSNYEIKEISENDFFKEPIDSYRKYELVRNYEDVYKTALLLNLTFHNNQQKDFEDVMKRILHCYYMAYRMCRKLDEYRTKYPYEGDMGLWEKDKKMKKIKHHAIRFRRLNEERIKKNK